MDVASLQSLPHSESLVRSPAISSTTTSFSFTTSSSSRSSNDGAPPLRSIDATELPRNDYHGAGPTVHHRGADGIDDADGDGVNENRVSACFSNSVASSHDIPIHTSVRCGAAAQSPIMGESQQQLPQHQHQQRRASLSSLPSRRSRRGSSELVSALSGHAHQPASATAGAAATAAARVLELQRPNSRPHSDRRRLRSDNNSNSSSGSSVHHSKAVSAVSAGALLLTRENSVASSFSASFKGFSPLARPPLPSPTAAASGVGGKARRSDSSVAAFASVLESSQVEAALQVYVERGGVAVADVTQALSTLPWRTAAPAKGAVVSPFIEASSESSRESLSEGSTAGKEETKGERRRKKRKTSEASPLSMLDPEGWLRVVAQATLAARTASADAGESNKREEEEEEEEVGVGEAEGSAHGEEMGVPPYRGPTALVFDRYGTFFAAGESGDRVASSSLSSRRPSTTGGVERPVSSMSASAPCHQSQQQQQHPQHNSHPSRVPSASAGRRLTFDTEDDDDGEGGGKEQGGGGEGGNGGGGGGESVTNGMEGHRPDAEQQQHFPVLQQLSSQQRPPSASLVSFSSQPLLSQPSPRVPTLTRSSMPPAASAQHNSRPPRSSATRTAANSKHTTTTTISAAVAAAITKLHSSSLPPRSASSSSLGGSVPLDDALFTRQLPTSTAAPAEEAGMQVLFQLCLCTPLGTSSSTMTEDDWTTLVDALRSDGHRKLPPAPILDHVGRTIAESIQLRGRHVGLNAADFAHILRAELTEVRRDLTSPKPEKMASAADGAEASRSAEFVRVEFPAHPDYLVAAREAATVATSAAAQRDTSGGLSWTRSEGGEGKGSWRVLPTWCMALAGMFPAEVSAICPTAVVRYLRSVALVKAVLMALIQRAEMEAAAMAEAAAQAATAQKKKGEEGRGQSALQLSTSKCMSADATGDGATSHPPQQQLVLNAVSSSTSHSRPVSAASQRIPSPVGVTDFVWPPRAGSLVSFSFSNAPVLAGAASVGGGRPTSSVVLTSLSREPTDWSQQHHPLPLPGRAAHSGAAVAVLHGGNDGLLYEPAVGNANTSLQDASGVASAAAVAPHDVSSSSPSGANGKLGFSNGTAAAAVADLSSSVPSASLSASVRATSSASHRYLQSRPLDEVGASVVARAKARRLLDSLRRSTVPINRYECFARVEQEDEPMQEPLCFVTKAELKRTLGDSDGDESSDSDAMSDLLAELTYDPAEVESMLRSREQEALSSGGAAAAAAGSGEGGEGRGGGGGHGGPYVELPQRASSAAYPPRHTVRPVVLPAAPVEKLLTNVFARPVRASVLARAARVSSAAALTPSRLEGGGTGVGGGGVTLREAAVGRGRLSSAQPPPLTGAAAVAPPPPVPGMFRMTGLLLGALPKKQEDALVARLSEPQYDPRKMGLRAASANLARPSAGPRADAVAAEEKARGQLAGGGKDNRQRQHALQTPEKAQRAAEGDGVRRHNTPRRSPRRTVTPPAGQPYANSGGGDGGGCKEAKEACDHHRHEDSSNRNRTPQSRRAPAAAPTPPSPSPRHTSATATPGKAVVRSPRLTRSQAAAYACFQPPPALLQAPLSPAAAALAAAQVMNGTSPPYKAAAGGGGAGSGVRAVVRGSRRGVSPRSTPVKPRSRPAAGVSPRPPSLRQQQQQQHPLRANPPDQPYIHHTFMLHAVESPRQRRPTLPLSPKGKQRRRQPRRRTAAPPSSRSNTQRRSTQRPPPSRTAEGKRGSGRSSGGASAAAVERTAMERTAKAVVEAEAPAADAAPAAAMSLYERRLLRRLQLSYIAENMTES